VVPGFDRRYTGKYLALRSERMKGVPEAWAKAFVVSPQISPIRRRQLESQGYVVVDAEAENRNHLCLVR
jgi:hypothetical protein